MHASSIRGSVLLLIDLQKAIDHPDWGVRNNPSAESEIGRLLARLVEDLSRRFGRGFGWRNLSQMRAFYLTWPAEQILQTLSAKSPPPAIVPTPSAIFPVNEASAPRARSFLSLATLAQAFPLPWSAYVRLLSLKNPNARSFYEAEALRGG